MRVVRTILGLLLLTVGIPALLIGGAFWAVMQHRDADGSFTGRLQPVVAPGYAVVVDNADQLLSADAPLARRGDTRLRLTALTAEGPAFIGLAPTTDVRRYLAEVPRQTVRSVNIGTGPLQIDGVRVAGSRAPAVAPGQAGIWLKAGNGQLDWNPAALRGSAYSLVIMSPSARPGLTLTATAAISPGWLNSSTWGLLILGSLVVLAGMIILAWPMRRREIVYVVEPSQVPDLVKAIGAPLPLGRTGGRHTGAHRPRTLADASRGRTPAAPPMVWPPARRGTPASLTAPETSTPVSPAPVSPAPVAPASPVPASSAPTSSAPVSPSVSTSSASSAPVSPAPGPVSPSAAVSPAAASSRPAAASSTPAAASSTPATASTSPSGPSTSPSAPHASRSGRRSAAPGEPLKLLGEAASGLSGASALLGSPAAALTPPSTGPARPAERIGRRRAPAQPEDTPVFEATAVGAWVAETTAARARETEARAAAVLAAEASKRTATADGGKGGASSAPNPADLRKAGSEPERVPTAGAPAAAEAAEPGAAAATPAGSKRPAASSRPVENAVAEKVTSGQAAAPTSSAKTDSTAKPESAAKPLAPVKPVDPAGPGIPKPAAAIKPGGSTRPVAPVEPVDPAGPSIPKPAAAIDSGSSIKPVAPTKPVDAAKSSAPAAAKPTGPAKPVTPAAPAKPVTPATPAKPVTPAAPAKPVTPATPPKPMIPAEQGGPVKPLNPPAPAASAGHVGPADPMGSAEQGGASAPMAAAKAPAPAARAPRPTPPVEIAPTSTPAGGTTPTQKIEAPAHVPLSDRPAAVGQPGHAVPPRRSPADGDSAAPALSGGVEIVPGSVAEVPRSTSEIQARLQAAMRTAGRPAGPRHAPEVSKPEQPGPQIGAQPGGPRVDGQPNERIGDGQAVTEAAARSSSYAAEAAELLAGLSPNRRRRKPAIERLGPKPRTNSDTTPTDD